MSIPQTSSAKQIVEKYIKSIFGFALKKTSSIQDAEELSQEILLRVFNTLLYRSDIQNIDGYVWKIAQNVWVNHINGKVRQRNNLSLDDFSDNLYSDDESVDNNFMKRETIEKLELEIAFLSDIQRKVVIMYYFHEIKQSEVARLLNLPLGTVKWHLFEAKNELRKGMDIVRNIKELKFNPVKFTTIGHNGSPGTLGDTSFFLQKSIAQNITYAAYLTPMTINELAECLGVSPVFIADEVAYLEEYGFLDKLSDEKYRTNVIIMELNIEHTKAQFELLKKAAELIAIPYFETFIALKHDIESSNIYYPDNDFNLLLWTLIPYAIDNSPVISKRKIEFEEVATMHKDGGHYIAHAMIDFIEKPDFLSLYDNLCGHMIRMIDDHTGMWQFNTQWSARTGGWKAFHTMDVNKVCGFLTHEDIVSEEDMAYLIEKGYVVKSGSEYFFNAVWVKDAQSIKNIIEPTMKIKEQFSSQLDSIMEEYNKLALDGQPEHIKKQIEYGNQYTLNGGQLICHVIRNLLDEGCLKVPTETQKKLITTLTIYDTKNA